MPTMRRVRALAAHIRPVIRRVDACAAVPSAPAWLYRQGDRVVVSGHAGLVQYVGNVRSLGDGLWVGVQFDEPVGTADPKLIRRLFECPPKHSGL